MTQALSVLKNPYRKHKKNSTVYTPTKLADFLYRIISPSLSPSLILDPAIGRGALTTPWRIGRHVEIVGIDINPNSKYYADHFICRKFEDVWEWKYRYPDLIMCNPPFNGAKGKGLYPEIFLRKIVELFGTEIPIVLFVPMGFRLNQKVTSKRWQWLRQIGMNITSIVSLPLDIFPKVKYHSEILIFNIPGLMPHYYLDLEACEGSNPNYCQPAQCKLKLA